MRLLVLLRAVDELETADRLGSSTSSSGDCGMRSNHSHQAGFASRRWYSSSSPASQRGEPGSLTRRQLQPQPLARLDLLLLRLLEITSRDRLWPGQIGGPLTEQPVAQREGRAAVLLVVGRDLVEQRPLTRCAAILEADDGVRARSHAAERENPASASSSFSE